jgi:CHASE3 domain sensor protein
MTSAGVVLGVLVLAVVVVLLLTIRAQTRAADAVVRNGDRALAATQLRNLVVDLQSGQRGFVVTADERFLDPFRSARRTFFGPEGRALVRGVGPRGPDLDRRIRSLIVDYLEPNIRTARRDRVRAQIAVASGFGRRRVDVLRGILAGVIAEATARRRASIADLRSRERLSAGLGVAGIALVALLIAAFTTYVVRAVVAPVRRVARAAHQIAGGRLDARVPGAEQAQAELRQMAASGCRARAYPPGTWGATSTTTSSTTGGA